MKNLQTKSAPAGKSRRSVFFLFLAFLQKYVKFIFLFMIIGKSAFPSMETRFLYFNLQNSFFGYFIKVCH